MAFKKAEKIEAKVYSNDIFDERGNMYLALGKIQWIRDDEEPDEKLAHIELRKWVVQQDGDDRPDKGFRFLTEEGPHELTHLLVEKGYGDTKKIIQSLQKRKDFQESVKDLYSDEDAEGNDGGYYDIRNALLAVSPEEDE